MHKTLAPGAVQLLKNAQQENSRLADLFLQFLDLQEAKSHQLDKPRVVSVGIYNAGKSSLFNSIAGKEVFQTGDVPTTAANQECELERFILVDTPGINANEADDTEAAKALMSAGVLVFTSNILRGGFDAIEMKLLKHIQILFGGVNAFADSILFVLTNSNQVEDGTRAMVIAKVKEQLASQLRLEDAMLFAADSVTFTEGTELQNDHLISLSGISEIREAVEMLAATSGKISKSRFVERTLLVINQMEDEIEKLKQPILIQRQQIIKELDELENRESELRAYHASLTPRATDIFSNKLKLRMNAYEPYPNLSYGTLITDYKFKSQSEAERAGRDKFNESYYRKRESCAKQMLRDMKQVYTPYLVYEMKQGNAYHDVNTMAASFVQEVISELKSLDLYNDSIRAGWIDFQIAPQIDSNAASYLNGYQILKDMLPGGEYYASSWYTKYIDTDSFEFESKKGWFDDGYRYKYDLWSSVKDFENDLKSHGLDASRCVWDDLSAGINGFLWEVQREISNRIAKLSAIVQEAEKKLAGSIQERRKTLTEMEQWLADIEDLRSVWCK